ncbi:ABC transporter ATP-binding protein [Alicyclobacillus fastidiosus]|uniref:ABC transporter ATP-binding protein n=1 Tax=Alicyclobacillus fastidiosus TaxID=392011 RepID=A0ABV5ADA9_9BACL|nr:ABC transporter ATP-binding protein [Alicyclobacillus fastidiosus]WEH12043.1 ABC transporter ATP-binding protein [Alicyclobacillus fastidiosus]
MMMGSGGHGSGGMGGGLGGGRNSWRLRELAENERFEWNIIRRALQSLTPYWPHAILTTLLLVLTSGTTVIPASLTQRIIDDGISKGNLRTILWLTVLLIAVSLVSGLLGVLQTWLGNIIAQNVMADYRLAIFRHIQAQTIRFFTTRQAGDLVSRVMNDVTAIQNVITTTMMGLVNNLLLIAFTTALMFSMNWRMSILALLVVPGFVLPTQRVGRARQRLQGRIQETLSAMTVHLSEVFGVSGALLVRIFQRERAEEVRFADTNRNLRDLQIRQTVIGRWLFMWLGMFSSIGPALLWGYGGWLVIHHRTSIGSIVAFTTLLGRLYGPLSQLAQLHVSVLSSIALFRRIFALLDIVPEVADGPVVLPSRDNAATIALREVTYAYPVATEEGVRRNVLSRVSLTIASGQTVALVGPSGAGKSTLINLMLRFFDPDFGVVEIDGVDARSLQLSSLRSQMGLVPQDPFFFHDTVEQNLLYAKPEATESEIEEACKAAQIHDTILRLPDGYQTLVGERGYRLSGGERQRLAIARVMLQAPRVVLLDEATSALDTLVERQIQTALAMLLEGRTAIVIAHRLSTILAADQIVVLNRGQVVATGDHESLLRSSALYRQLYEAQFSER